jgi:hypothetical protein
MSNSVANPKQQAHELIERMPQTQIPVVIGLLQRMLDPVTRSLVEAPLDDEIASEEEQRSVAASKAWLESNDPISNDEILADFGITSEDFQRMSHTTLEAHNTGR